MAIYRISPESLSNNSTYNHYLLILPVLSQIMVSTADIFILLPILFHRIGLILSVVGAVVLVLLPFIYNQKEDLEFSKLLVIIFKRITQTGLFISVLTGLMRLDQGVPSNLWIKLVVVTITLVWVFRIPEYEHDTYKNSTLILLGLICLTAVVGILL